MGAGDNCGTLHINNASFHTNLTQEEVLEVSEKEKNTLLTGTCMRPKKIPGLTWPGWKPCILHKFHYKVLVYGNFLSPGHHIICLCHVIPNMKTRQEILSSIITASSQRHTQRCRSCLPLQATQDSMHINLRRTKKISPNFDFCVPWFHLYWCSAFLSVWHSCKLVRH